MLKFISFSINSNKQKIPETQTTIDIIRYIIKNISLMVVEPMEDDIQVEELVPKKANNNNYQKFSKIRIT